jgi:LmbE family N-acetylglucosaminyl deacetylase
MPAVQVVTDRITYNAGDIVRVKIASAPPSVLNSAQYFFTIRYLGDTKPLAENVKLGEVSPDFPGYRTLWKTPPGVKAGRYAIDLQSKSSASPGGTSIFSDVGAFVIHRQEVEIISAEVGQSFYTPGDSMGCSIKVENLTNRSISGLRLEFSERYWPWIAQQTAKVGQNISSLGSDIQLKPHQPSTISSTHCIVAAGVTQPSIKQYVAVLWDHDRKNVFALRFTPLVFINPPGAAGLRPYPGQYVYPSLNQVDTTSYRKFHPKPFQSGAVQFDLSHTQFASGTEAAVKFTIFNPSDDPWREATLRARLMGPDGKEVAHQVLPDHLDLKPDGPKLTQVVKFPLPPNVSGIFHAEVEISDASGQVHAANRLELGVNPLPKSVLIFCAHQDDETTQLGFIRALVENQIPVQVVYFTSGDAGACDRYYQHTCGPAEALNYGPIRMQESRAALAHMGVAPENVLCLGLPDGGTGKIWYEHLASNHPYLAVLLASDHAPYDNLAAPNLPFAREAVLDETKDIIRKFQPEVIFTVHPPAEGHIDHIVNNFFVVKAMQELLREGAISPEVELRVDPIFDPREHPATPYHYEAHDFFVSAQVMALAQEAGWYYESQDGNHAMGTIQPWNQLPHSQGYRKVLDWKEHEGWNDKP